MQLAEITPGPTLWHQYQSQAFQFNVNVFLAALSYAAKNCFCPQIRASPQDQHQVCAVDKASPQHLERLSKPF